MTRLQDEAVRACKVLARETDVVPPSMLDLPRSPLPVNVAALRVWIQSGTRELRMCSDSKHWQKIMDAVNAVGDLVFEVESRMEELGA